MQKPVLGPTKTPSSVRTIPVPDGVIDVLARHVELYTPERSELLFLDDKGDPIRRNALGHAWRRLRSLRASTASRRMTAGTTPPR